MCTAVEVGLEKLRYLLFASPGAAKSLVSAAFFTERERPTEAVMHNNMYSEGGSNTVFGYCLIIVKVLNCIQAYLLTGQSKGRLMILHISGPADGFPNAITEIFNFA